MKYRVVRIYANCQPGLRGVSGRRVDAVLELPAGEGAKNGLKEGQIIGVNEMGKSEWVVAGSRELGKQCPSCGRVKSACKGTAACFKAAGFAEEKSLEASLDEIRHIAFDISNKLSSGRYADSKEFAKDFKQIAWRVRVIEQSFPTE